LKNAHLEEFCHHLQKQVATHEREKQELLETIANMSKPRATQPFSTLENPEEEKEFAEFSKKQAEKSEKFYQDFTNIFEGSQLSITSDEEESRRA